MHARFWVILTLACLSVSQAWAKLEFSHARLDVQAGPALMDSGYEYGISGQFQFGLNDTHNLRHDRAFQLFHVRFLTANAYQSISDYQYGLTGVLAGASIDINGNPRRGEFGVMPSVLVGTFRLSREFTGAGGVRRLYSVADPEPVNADDYAGALLAGLRLQGPVFPRTSLRVEAYGGVIKNRALLVEAAVDVELYRNLSVVVSGQFCDIEEGTYPIYDSVQLGESVFSASGWEGWGFLFAGLQLSF
ncbi:hypothetical protein KQI52_07195 [bacterium]|nr:hypothetical protein [bacterium]